MLGHVDEVPGQAVRSAYWRRGQYLSPPRGRTGPERGIYWSSVCELLGPCSTPAGRWTEDGEIDRQCLYASRDRGARLRSNGPALLLYHRALSQPRQFHLPGAPGRSDLVRPFARPGL